MKLDNIMSVMNDSCSARREDIWELIAHSADLHSLLDLHSILGSLQGRLRL